MAVTQIGTSNPVSFPVEGVKATYKTNYYLGSVNGSKTVMFETLCGVDTSKVVFAIPVLSALNPTAHVLLGWNRWGTQNHIYAYTFSTAEVWIDVLVFHT